MLNLIKKKIIKLQNISKSIKFSINCPYIALLSHIDEHKLQFGYKSYNLNIGPIIASLFTGEKFTFNIVSFVDKNLIAKLVFKKGKIDEESKELMDCFSIKSIIPSTDPISIYFKVPSSFINKKNKLKGKLEIQIEETDSKIKLISIYFEFNVILLPLKIYFKSYNGKLFWDVNRLVLINNIFSEHEKLRFEYIIRNYFDNFEFLNKYYSILS